ncbi:MAG: dehydrogenase E1 component subunit alpha/beta [Actinobacteria bacterium]|nr:dehydrogenase E1 component subunit alpha/beta [Actinomycetota bacterium]
MVKEIKSIFECKKDSLKFKTIPVCSYGKSLDDEIAGGSITRKKALDLLEHMYMIRTLEDMLEQIKLGLYKSLPKFNYVGPTHLSIGQEATAAGSVWAIGIDDYITSSHRGHGDAMAKGCSMIKLMSDKSLLKLLTSRQQYLEVIGEDFSEGDSREKLEEKALKIHTYRMIAELFGKAHGYCRGVGGGMHIADFELGHLGANAIVGGHVPIAAGAAMSVRYRQDKNLVLCLAGDGSFSNGAVLESLNIATMAQFKNGLMGRKFGLPIIFGIVNNQYAMSGQSVGEITGIDFMARRAAGFDTGLMHAEVVDGMDVLAVADSVKRAKDIIKKGDGPVLLEFMTYRYKGHSLSDPLTYRDREELAQWRARDAISTYEEKLKKAKFPTDQGSKITEKDIKDLSKKVSDRNAAMAVYAAAADYPKDSSMLAHLFSSKTEDKVPKEYSNPKPASPLPKYKRDDKGQINARIAVREAIIEEMARDRRVITFGEDIADYGGAFGVTNDLLKTFSRDRVFNISISEAGMVGAAVGMAMTGLRPIVEIMYNDFIMQALGQIGNQAAKWSYMSGGQISVPMVLRTTIGGGKGYAGQHSQSLEALVTHIPGLKVVAPASAHDFKGLLKSAIRDENPVIFFEQQLIYNSLGAVPQEEYLVPIGKAKILRQGKDITIVCWSYMVEHSLKAAEILEDQGISAEVVDIRTLIPLDIETIIASVKKTGKAIVTSQEVTQSGFASEIITQIQESCFDWLDAPIQRLGAPNGIPPSAENLEKLFLPDAEKLVRIIKEKY